MHEISRLNLGAATEAFAHCRIGLDVFKRFINGSVNTELTRKLNEQTDMHMYKLAAFKKPPMG